VLAVDPTSPFTGGAILGDRIRMQRMRKTRAFLSGVLPHGAPWAGLPRPWVMRSISWMSWARHLIVETVGTGQQEVEIINHSHTVIVVLIPGMGDEIQAIKAGIWRSPIFL